MGPCELWEVCQGDVGDQLVPLHLVGWAWASGQGKVQNNMIIDQLPQASELLWFSIESQPFNTREILQTCLKECIQKCENTFAEWFLIEHVLNFVEQYSSALFSHLSSSVLLPQFDQHQFVNALAVAGCDHDVALIVWSWFGWFQKGLDCLLTAVQVLLLHFNFVFI